MYVIVHVNESIFSVYHFHCSALPLVGINVCVFLFPDLCTSTCSVCAPSCCLQCLQECASTQFIRTVTHGQLGGFQLQIRYNGERYSIAEGYCDRCSYKTHTQLYKPEQKH